MLNFEAFSRYLIEEPKLQPLQLNSIGSDGKYIHQWSATLGMESETIQYQKIERLLAKLNVADIEDSERLRILHKVQPVIQRLIVRLHRHYIYAPSLLTDEQQHQASQVRSLYYLLILIYQGVISRVVRVLDSERKGRLKKLVRSISPAQKLLAQALHKQSGLYVDLLVESAILYERVPNLYWKQLKHLYLLAQEHDCIDVSVIRQEGSEKAKKLEDYCCQACLLSLLRLKTYRRQDIINIYKVLNEWAQKIHITHDIDSSLEVFVDLNSDEPPQYITAETKTNPYDEKAGQFVFLNLEPLIHYLKEFTQEVPTNINSTQVDIQLNKQRLAKLVLHSLQYHPRPVRNICDDKACLIQGLSLIHYYIAGHSSLYNIIEYAQIPSKQRPLANTKPKTTSKEHQLTVKVTEIGKTSCRLLWDATTISDEDNAATNFNLQVQSLVAVKRIDNDTIDRKDRSSGRSGISLNSLNPEILSRDTWELGVIRSMVLQDKIVDMKVEIIGTSATACGIRLDNKDGRRQDFVPALLLAKDTKLGSKTSLIVPNYHLRSGDRVVIRVANKERLLILEDMLLHTDNVEQYLIKRVAI